MAADLSRTDGSPPSLAGVEHRYVDVGGLKVHIAEAGAGEPVLLVHGWPQHWWAWRYVIPALAERYRVICPDLRGHGWTDAPRGGYEKEQLATDLLGLLDALGLERVRLVGHDWGGFACLLATLRAPERCSHLLALSIAHPWPARTRPSPRRLARFGYQLPLATPVVGRELLRRTSFASEVLTKARVAGSWTPEELATYVDRWSEPARADATSALYRTFLLRELRPLLRGTYRDSRLVPPTRLVLGARDVVMAAVPLEGFERHADDMTVEWLPGLGHFLPEEDPEAIVQRALELFDS